MLLGNSGKRKGILELSGREFKILLQRLVSLGMAHNVRKRAVQLHSLGDIVRLIARSKRALVLTGAGISTSCGIPDFRSADGVYSMLGGYQLKDPQDLFSIRYFKRNTKPFYDFARKLWPGTHSPAPTHRFIKCLEDAGSLQRNYTQNIDTLEDVAGIRNVLQCHGSFATATCTRCKFKCPGAEIKDAIMNRTAPLCPQCLENPRPSLMEEYVLRDPQMKSLRMGSLRSMSVSSESDSNAERSTSPVGPAAPASASSAVARTNPLSVSPRAASVSNPAGTAASKTNLPLVPDSPFASSAKMVFGNQAADPAITASKQTEAMQRPNKSQHQPPPQPPPSLRSSGRSNSLGSENGDVFPPPSPSMSQLVTPRSTNKRQQGVAFMGDSPLPSESVQLAPISANTNDAPGPFTDQDDRELAEYLAGKSHQDGGAPPFRKNSLDFDGPVLPESPMLTPRNNELKSQPASSSSSSSSSSSTSSSSSVASSSERGYASIGSPEIGDLIGSELPFIDAMYDKGIMKPDIVFFGESLPEKFFDGIEKDVRTCDLCLVMGTSLKVAPVSKIIEMVDAKTPQILINRELVAQPHEFDAELLGNCDDVTRILARRLGWDLDGQGSTTPSASSSEEEEVRQDPDNPYRFLFSGAVESSDSEASSSNHHNHNSNSDSESDSNKQDSKETPSNDAKLAPSIDQRDSVFGTTTVASDASPQALKKPKLT